VTTSAGDHGDRFQASPWILRFAPMLGSGHRVLDVACGGGRHARLFAERGCRVTAVDREAAPLASLRAETRIAAVLADLETGHWPFAEAAFDAVIVTNYLHRPLFPSLLAALAPDGLLLYETFAVGNAAFGKPSNPDFLLRPRELLELTATLRVIAFEDGYSSVPRPAVVQRIAARRHDVQGLLPIELAAL
jgi:SAM-dependent methyltransferase